MFAGSGATNLTPTESPSNAAVNITQTYINIRGAGANAASTGCLFVFGLPYPPSSLQVIQPCLGAHRPRCAWWPGSGPFHPFQPAGHGMRCGRLIGAGVHRVDLPAVCDVAACRGWGRAQRRVHLSPVFVTSITPEEGTRRVGAFACRTTWQGLVRGFCERVGIVGLSRRRI